MRVFIILLFSAAAASAALTPTGSLQLSATFENGSIVLPLNNATPADLRTLDSTAVEYRETGASVWRRGHPLSIIANIPMNDTFGLFADTLEDLFDARGVAPDYRLAGSLFSLRENVNYDVRVTMYAGGAALPSVTGNFRALSDAFPATGRDFYVNQITGSDAFTGTGSSAAKKTLAGAVALGLLPGDKVHVAPGTYYETLDLNGLQGTTSNYVHFLAEGQGVILDGADEAIAAGNVAWTFFQNDMDGNPLYYAPASWYPMSVYTVAPGKPDLNGALYQYHYKNWGYGGNDLQDLINNEVGLNAYGSFYYDTTSARLYAALGGRAKPDTVAMRVGRRDACVRIKNCEYILLRGFTITHGNRYGVTLEGSRNIVQSHCRFVDIERPIYTPIYQDSQTTDFCVVESCTFAFPKTDTWVRNASNGWSLMHGDSTDSGGYDMGYNNALAMELHQAGGGWVIRGNTFDTLFDGIRFSQLWPAQEKFFSPQFYANMDVHDNLFRAIYDDGLEPEGAAVNLRIYGNTLDGVHMGFSDCPTTVGPVYFMRNTISNWSFVQASGNAIKSKPLGETLHDFGVAFHYHNTFYVDSGSAARTLDTYNDYFDTYQNNIFVGGPEVFKMNRAVLYNAPMRVALDYNSYYTRQANGVYIRTVSTTCRDATCVQSLGFEAHGLFAQGASPSFSSGLFLSDSAREVDAGLYIAGVNDGYAGLAPDMGAHEFTGGIGISIAALPPARPPLTVSPNPFGSAGVIALHSSFKNLSIYDVRGRRVAELAGGHERRGTQYFSWDGRDSFGKRLTSGVYFAAASDGKRALRRPFVILK